MFYDLNVPWTADHAENQRKVAFLAELGYNVLALSHTISAAQKLPPKLECPIPTQLPFAIPPGVQILRRTTLILSDTSQNHRIADMQGISDILAIRPTDEKSFQQTCNGLDCDLVSVDLSQRHYYPFKHKTLNSATERGVKIELCYSPGLIGDAAARRNLIQNATSIIRATRGRGIVISGEAQSALACRSPWDVVNLAAVWGLGQERGKEAVTKEARWVVAAAQLKRTSYRGAIDVIYGGEKPDGEIMAKNEKHQPQNGTKRKAGDVPGGEQQLSKRAQKRKAAQEREAAAAAAATATATATVATATAATATAAAAAGGAENAGE